MFTKGIKKSKYDKDWNWYANLINGRKESDEWAIIRRVRETHWNEFCQIQQGEKVLDAGCGNGDYTRLLLLRGANVWAFDYAKEMVAATKERLEKNGLKTEELTVNSVVNIPYPDEMFDAVICLAVIDHVPDEERLTAVAELARVLRPGKFLYINTPNRWAYHWRLGHWVMRHLHLFPKGKICWFTPKMLKDLVRSVGLIPEESLALEFIPPFSGLYTSDLRRRTFFPKWLISILDKLYLVLEIRVRRIEFFKKFCLHYFLRAQKPVSKSS